jgi:hypothetical protein
MEPILKSNFIIRFPEDLFSGYTQTREPEVEVPKYANWEKQIMKDVEKKFKKHKI